MVNKSVIGANVKIGSRCKIVGSIIFGNVTIEDDCNINNSILCSEVHVGTKCKILNSQVPHQCSIPPGMEIKPDS